MANLLVVFNENFAFSVSRKYWKCSVNLGFMGSLVGGFLLEYCFYSQGENISKR